MSYQVLARKWRPGTFGEMVGQTHVLRALANALDQNRLHHAYLFTGTRGVGKTTIARIFAKCVNCETGISATPCGTCDTCKEITEGRFVDLIEIDAASHTGVSEIREILDNVQYAPTRGRYKIYLIDEVHMLSNSSFNALLKTLEEPPPHIKFLLATTDPQKLPITVLSRCLQFNLKNLSEKRIQQHLAHVLSEEGVSFEEEALWEIARSADGSMRDALSLADQAIAFGEGGIRTADVVDMLGTVDRQVGRKLLAHVLAGQRAEALSLTGQVAERSPDWKVLLQGIAELAHRVTLEQTVPGIVDDAQGDQAYVRELAAIATPEQLQLVYQIALAGLRDLSFAPTPRIGFEMTLVRMLAFTPECPTGIIPAAGGSSQGEPAPEAVEASATVSEAAPQSQGTVSEAAGVVNPVVESVGETVVADNTEAPEAPSEADGEMLADADIEIPEPVSATEDPDAWRDALSTEPAPSLEHPPSASVHDEAGVPQVTEAKARNITVQVAPGGLQADAPAPANAAQTDSGGTTDVSTLKAVLEVRDPWLDCYASLELRGMTANLCQRLALVKVDGNAWHFEIDPGHSGFLTQMHQARLTEALSAATGQPVSLHIEAAAHDRVTPMAKETARARLNQLNAESVIHADPNVQQLLESFDGALLPGSIRPADRTQEVKHV